MVQEINNDLFKKEVLEHKGVVVVDFWAPWCGPCKMLAPVLERISSQYPKIKFAKVNIDDNSDLASEHGIMGIPCMVFFKNGKEADRVVGFNGEEPLRMKLNSFM